MVSSTMPDASAATLELTLVEQGDDVYHRHANHIYCKGCNISGYVQHPNADVYLVLSKNGTVPSYGDFQNRVGGFLYATQRSEFVVLGTLAPKNTFLAGTASGFNNTVRFSKRFNISTFYNGTASGTGVRNRIYLVVKNDTGGVLSYGLNCELFFRDN